MQCSLFVSIAALPPLQVAFAVKRSRVSTYPALILESMTHNMVQQELTVLRETTAGREGATIEDASSG